MKPMSGSMASGTSAGLTYPEVSILRMKNGLDEKSVSGLQCAPGYVAWCVIAGQR